MRTLHRPLVALVMSIALMTGCALSQEVKTKAEQAKTTVTEAEKSLGERKTAYSKVQGSEDWTFYQPYAERENWANNFTQAESDLRHGKELVGQINPILQLNKSEKERDLQNLISQVEVTVRAVNTKSKATGNRMEELKKTRDEAPQLVGTADRERLETAQVFRALEQFTEEAKTRHPDRTTDIVAKFGPIQKLNTDVQTAFASASTELKKSQSGQFADYASLADSVKVVSAGLASIKKQDTDYRAKISELDKSYTKTLVDMNQVLTVTIGRTSWDEDDDWPSEHDYEYPAVEVDDATFDYFDAMAENTVVANYGSWGGYKVASGVDAAMMAKLNIEAKAGWPSSWDDSAEYWISDTDQKCQHRYKYEENGETREGGWEDVDCDTTYDQHVDDIGMTLVAKPYGAFEEEKQVQAAPAGMAYVGDTHYGEWKQDPQTGSSFWEFYGKYAMFRDLLGGPVYRDNWDDWHTNYRGRQPYYGPDDDDEPRWGSSSAQAKRRYGTTTFAKRGGLETAQREAQAERAASSLGGNKGDSVRGAGPSRRAGGPGGGGK